MVVLEPAARRFADACAGPPYLHQIDPAAGRTIVDEAQADPPFLPDAEVSDRTVPGGPGGAVPIRVVRPRGGDRVLPVILYLHGLGWVFGNPHTHDRLVRELAIGARAAVVFPDYSLSPEARYPTALEEIWAVVCWIASGGAGPGFDPDRVAVAGDSAGGNLAIAMTLLAERRGVAAFVRQVLFYPVTDASFDTRSYHEFAEGYLLRRDAMIWFWDQYAPDPARRAEITASPLRATTDLLSGLPPALVIVGEADVLRDEGEAYAAKLRAAGVPVTAVRYQGIIHDFAAINALRGTRAAEAAITQAIAFLRAALHPIG